MSSKKPLDSDDKLGHFYDDLRRERQQTHRSYRDRALSLLPHVCAMCGRDFEGKKLRELTVHHKDSDSTNNPPDGSNWELLCFFCHDNEHGRNNVSDALHGDARATEREASRLHQPFAGLADMLKKKDE